MAKERPLLLARLPFLSSLDGWVPVFLGHPRHREPELPPVAAVVVAAVAATAARAAKVFLLRLPFGHPHFRDTGGIIFDTSAFFPLPSGTPSPPTAEPLREDMAGQSLEERRRKEWKCALNHECSQHLKGSGEGDGTRHFGNRSRIVCTCEKATATVATADCGRN
jgi:hypothetical protein